MSKLNKKIKNNVTRVYILEDLKLFLNAGFNEERQNANVIEEKSTNKTNDDVYSISNAHKLIICLIIITIVLTIYVLKM